MNTFLYPRPHHIGNLSVHWELPPQSVRDCSTLINSSSLNSRGATIQKACIFFFLTPLQKDIYKTHSLVSFVNFIDSIVCGSCGIISTRGSEGARTGACAPTPAAAPDSLSRRSPAAVLCVISSLLRCVFLTEATWQLPLRSTRRVSSDPSLV